ncbi:MAG: hypothetical protein KGJ02_01400 [Verrucomicrobiota bacterium]|nr:hypothetical protein [Verrucomicrobiota bacterium]
MFFEKIGHLFFTKIRFPFSLLLLVICPLFSTLYLLHQMETIETQQERYTLAAKKAKAAFARKERKERFLAKHLPSDSYFLDTEIASFSFLQRERDSLQKWILHPAISQKNSMKERLQFLEERNRISFVEEATNLSSTCKETIEKQRHPVEMDAKDLQTFLSLIEETIPRENEKKRPQLLVHRFSLHKKETPLHNEVFEVSMDLFKREFLTP